MSSVTEVFAALGDPNRQLLLEALVRHGGAVSATTLAAPLEVTRQAVTKHLTVLERAGLVTSRRSGREVLYAVNRENLDRSAAWLADLAARWDDRLLQVKARAETGVPPEST